MRLALAGGGTGGHLSPGFGLLETMEASRPGSEALFLAALHSGRLPEKRPGRFWVGIPARRFNLKKWWKLPAALAGNLSAYRQSYTALADFRPAALLGLGGYVSVPPVLAAFRLGIPVVLLEQNRIMGRANRHLEKGARVTALTFPLEGSPVGHRVLTGIPLGRRVKEESPPPELPGPEWPVGVFTLLVMGGSRGAKFINHLLRRSLPAWKTEKGDLRIIHLSGAEDAGMLRAVYREAGISARVFPYLKEMGWAYRHADLLIARAGAATLAEAAYWGLPSLLIPYPWATDQHQLANARYFEAKGGALVLEEAVTTPEELTKIVKHFSDHPDELKNMSARAHSLFLPHGGERLLELLERAAGGEKISGSNTDYVVDK